MIAIIGILSAVVLASLNTAREKGRIAAAKEQDSSLYSGLGPDLVAAWNFDEGSGTTLYDSSGNNNTGSYPGAVWTNVTPYGTGTALTFSNGNLATFTNVQGLSSSVVTVTAWVYLTTNRNWADIVNNNWIGNGWLLYTNANGNADFGVGQASTQYNDIGNISLSLNAWHFLVGTYDGSKVTLYVDGAQDGTPAAVSNATLTNSGTITVGGGTIGNVDNVRIYASPLQLAEIQKLFAEGPPETARMSTMQPRG